MNIENGTTVIEPEIIPPEVTRQTETAALAKRYTSEAELDLITAKALAVTDDAGYEDAGRTRLEIDAKRKRAEQIDELVCKPLYDHWKNLKALFKPSIELRVQAAKILGDKRIAYDRAKQAEAERIRKLQEEEARKEQARLDKLAMERAARAEAAGKTEKAQEILDTIPQVAMPTGPVFVAPKTAGIAKTTYWFHRVTDLQALVTAVAAGEVPLEAVMANDQWLGKTAKALQKNMRYPGVETYSEDRERGTGR